MGLMILEVLQGKEPNGKNSFTKNESLKVIYDLCRKHQGEIEEARERGYSWTQIDDACREAWQEQSNLAEGIVWWKGRHFIESCYKVVKNGTTAKSKAKKKAKPLTLNVTVEKR